MMAISCSSVMGMTHSSAALGLLAPAVGDTVDPRGLLFLDTETTGLAGGTGTYAFLVGLARIDGARLRLTQLFMRDLDEEPALLAALATPEEIKTGCYLTNPFPEPESFGAGHSAS